LVWAFAATFESVAHAVFQRVHVVIRESEMMPRLVNHHVAHQGGEPDAGVLHFCKQGLAEQRDDRGQGIMIPLRTIGQGNAFIQPGQPPRIGHPHSGELFAGGKFFDPQHHISQWDAELRG